MPSLGLMCLLAALSLTGGVSNLSTTRSPSRPPFQSTSDARGTATTINMLLDGGTDEAGSGLNDTLSYPTGESDTFADDDGVEERDVRQGYLIKIGLQVLWHDIISQYGCHNVSYLSVICQQVELTLGDNFTTFLGTRPNNTGMVEVVFEGDILRSQLQNKSSALHKITIPDYSRNVQVPVQVIITQLPNPGGSLWTKYSVQPDIGPRSGGTPITIHGYGLDKFKEVNIGHQVCNITSRSQVLILCTTPRSTGATLVDKGQNITLHTTRNVTRPTGFSFTYARDPNITLIEPTDTILGGGVLLTVHGTNLNTVKIRIMIVTVTNLDNNRTATYRTSCTGKDPDFMLCPTPPIALGDVQRRRKRSKTTASNSITSINVQQNLRIVMSFVMDGVDTFKELKGTHLQQCSELTVYSDPELSGFKGISRGISLTFIPIWPVSDTSIEIRGERLLDGLRPENYEVYIGEARCTNMMVYSNLIVCHPPPTRPQMAKENRAGQNRIPVKVLYAKQVSDIGYLSYTETLWEYPPGRYTIIGGSAGLLLLLIILIVVCCCCCCHRRRDYHLGGSKRSAPCDTERDQLELLEEIRLEMSRRDVNNIPKYVNDADGKHNVTPASVRAEDRFIKVNNHAN